VCDAAFIDINASNVIHTIGSIHARWIAATAEASGARPL
jgi:hypothetical protein